MNLDCVTECMQCTVHATITVGMCSHAAAVTLSTQHQPFLRPNFMPYLITCSLHVGRAPRIFPWRGGGGVDPEAIYNSGLILKIML
jgi:hypothetical protein